MENNENNIDILDDLEVNYLERENKEIHKKIISDVETENTMSEEQIDTIYLEDENSKDSFPIPEQEISRNLEDSNIIEKKKSNSILKHFVFLCKYIITSALIFGILMVSTNYSAYLNIAKSHIYKEKIETESRGIISSVEASNIKEKVKENKQKEEEKKEEIKEDERGSEYSINKLVAGANKKDIDLDIEITPYENRIIIPKIGKNVPLVDIKNRKIEGEEELNSIFMEELENGVIRYPGSATPGNDGTTFVFGHSSNFPWIEGDYNEVFSLLDNVVYNDDIIIYYGQKKYTYKIREKKVIKPGDVSVLKRNKNKSELTLMTCWPIGTTLKRLVVTGELVEEEI